MTTSIFKTDAQIRQDTLDELERDWRFKPAEIGVEVDQGVVTLTGTVSSYTKLLAAGDITADIAGVRGVANELTVRTPGMGLPNDAEIAGAVRNALKWDPDVPDEKIEVLVRNGAVTLKGTVDYWYQRKAACDTAMRISGVGALNDHITVTPPRLVDADVRDEIRKALKRRIPLASDNIGVHVSDGTVTLTGNVQFYSDRLQAERAAWMTEGVRNVVNSLSTTW